MNHPLMIHVPDVMPLNFAPPPPPPQVRDRQAQPIMFVVGVDLGQSRDFTALVVNEISLAKREHLAPGPWQEVLRTESLVHHAVKHIERLPLGTPYPQIVEHIRARLNGLPAMPRPAELVVDATGVGRPVIDMIRAAGMKPVAVTITGGGSESEPSRMDHRVAKKLLAMGIAVALDTGRLTVPAPGEHRETLGKEMRAFKVTVNPNANETYEAWREKDHDDLVLAAALSVWLGNRQGPRYAVNPGYNGTVRV